MKVRITTIDQIFDNGKPEVTEHETSLDLHSFILADMGGLYPNMQELKADFIQVNDMPNKVELSNENYGHTYEIVN